jgi:hypothetical protein
MAHKFDHSIRHQSAWELWSRGHALMGTWEHLDTWSAKLGGRTPDQERNIFKSVTAHYLSEPTILSSRRTPMFLRMVCPATQEVIWGWHYQTLRVCHPDVPPYGTHPSPA